MNIHKKAFVCTCTVGMSVPSRLWHIMLNDFAVMLFSNAHAGRNFETDNYVQVMLIHFHSKIQYCTTYGNIACLLYTYYYIVMTVHNLEVTNLVEVQMMTLT